MRTIKILNGFLGNAEIELFLVLSCFSGGLTSNKIKFILQYFISLIRKLYSIVNL